MLILTEDARVVCAHRGVVSVAPTQDVVTISGRRVLVESNPVGRPILRCPHLGATIKPCQRTLQVRAGYSEFIRVEGNRICLSTIKGLTDGTPPGVVEYLVAVPGQNLVEELS